jgi:hypothetical protein
VKAAIAIADWFSQQQLQLLEARRLAGIEEKRSAILDLLQRKPNGITARDVQRSMKCSTAEAARNLLDQMVQDETLDCTDVPTGGRTQRLYTLGGGHTG